MTPAKRTAIAGEVGPTHCRFAVVDREELHLDHFVNFRCADFQSFEQAFAAYLRSLPAHPDVLSLAVAGTVKSGHATVGGTGWRLIRRHLETAMSMRHVSLVRDISARALAVPLLDPHEKHKSVAKRRSLTELRSLFPLVISWRRPRSFLFATSGSLSPELRER